MKRGLEDIVYMCIELSIIKTYQKVKLLITNIKYISCLFKLTENI